MEAPTTAGSGGTCDQTRELLRIVDVVRLILQGSLLLIAVSLVGCSGASNWPVQRGPDPETRLTILAVNANVGRAAFHLSCGPAGGDLPNPRGACAALDTTPELITRPKPFVCIGGSFSWWEVTINGRLNGDPIHRNLSTCWTTQMATLGRFEMSSKVLQKHLLPRRHEAVLAGTERVFPPGVLRPGDLVTCDIRGHHLALGVPTETGPGASTGYNGVNVVSVTLTVAQHRDGSVSASCHTGGS